MKVRERFVRFCRAQTMTEYAVILVAISGSRLGIYKSLGNNIGSLASDVDSTLNQRVRRLRMAGLR